MTNLKDTEKEGNVIGEIIHYTRAHFMLSILVVEQTETVRRFVLLVIVDAGRAIGRWPCHHEIFEATSK